MADYSDEAQRLQQAYSRAVGDALELGLQVHVRGRMKALGDLQDEILAKRQGPGAVAARKAFYGALADALERGQR